MTDNQQHQEIRQEAVSLAWLLSGEIKSIDAVNAIFVADRIKSVGEAINYLLAIACDDWSNVTGFCAEIESLSLPAFLSELDDNTGARWNSFVHKVAKAEGKGAPLAKSVKPTSKLCRESYIMNGLELGHLKQKVGLLNRERYFI